MASTKPLTPDLLYREFSNKRKEGKKRKKATSGEERCLFISAKKEEVDYEVRGKRGGEVDPSQSVTLWAGGNLQSNFGKTGEVLLQNYEV